MLGKFHECLASWRSSLATNSHRSRSRSARTRGFQIRCFVFSATLKEYPADRAAFLSLSPTSFSRMNVRCRRVSPFRRSDLLASAMCCIVACSEALIASDSESRKAGCRVAVSSDSFIRPPACLTSRDELSTTLLFLNSYRPTYSWWALIQYGHGSLTWIRIWVFRTSMTLRYECHATSVRPLLITAEGLRSRLRERSDYYAASFLSNAGFSFVRTSSHEELVTKGHKIGHSPKHRVCSDLLTD
jgi:hypothetical protein